jgi:hypothetical protein
MPGERDLDERALLLRDGGLSYARTATELDLAGALEANAAFNRALRRRTVSEQAALRSREMARLDALCLRLRRREGVSEEELARQLRGVRRLRKSLFVT